MGIGNALENPAGQPLRTQVPQVIFKGTGFSSIRHFKDEVEQIGAGKECGIHISGYTVRAASGREA